MLLSQHFLVELTDTLDDEPSFAHIIAPDAETAITTFLTAHAPTDAVFRDYVYRPALNLSFAEHFWIRTDDDDARFDQGQLQLSDDVFAERVQQFFGTHHDYADLYLTYYFNAEGSDSLRPTFPPAMFAYIWLETEYGEVSAILVGEG